MNSQQLSLPQANLKMALWQVEAEAMSSSSLYVWLDNIGLPYEVGIRLHELITYTKKISNKILAVGKMILIRIIEFVKAHPHLSIGIAVGAAVGFLVNTIPFIGPVLAPLAAALGMTIGAIAGHRLDKDTQDKRISNSGIIEIIGITEDLIEITRDFFALLADVFNIFFRHVVTA